MTGSVQPRTATGVLPNTSADAVPVPAQDRVPPDAAVPPRVLVHTPTAPAAVIPAPAPPPETTAVGGPAASFPLRGRTDHFFVYFDDSLGANGAALADALLSTCESDYGWMQTWFDDHTAGAPEFHVYVRPGSNGAVHASCTSTTVYVDAFAGTDGDLARYLLASEVAEVFMALQGAGWNCGASNGEALSRVVAGELYPGTADQTAALGITFNAGASWLDGGRPNWVDATEQVDTDFTSIGCGTLFLNWLQYQLGYPVKAIVAAGGPNLASTYQQLTGRADGFARFSALLQKYFPAGTPSGLRTDNPFPLSDPTPPFPSRTLTSADILYQVHADATLNWFRFDRWSNGESGWSGPSPVGTGWLGFRHVFGGGGFTVYVIDQAGQLRWYRHDGANGGTGLETPGAWADGSGKVVGTGWQGFATVFSPGGGLIYGIDAQGRLRWYRHNAFQTGEGLETSGAWADGSGNVVGTGWGEFVTVFGFLADGVAGPTGFPAAVIYGVLPDGTLRWYRHDHAGTGDGLDTAGAWGPGSGAVVGWGWTGMDHLLAPTGNGSIFAVSPDGTVHLYVHTGYRTGKSPNEGGWAPTRDVRYGWHDLPLLFALAPGLPAPGPH